MRLAFFGDVVGHAGRTALVDYLKTHKSRCGFDFIVVNGENAAHGFGITQRMCNLFFDCGIDVITMGNHTFDKQADLQMFDRNKNLIRPINYIRGTPGHGYTIVEMPYSKRKVMVINLIGHLFMGYNEHPFFAMEDVLSKYRMKANVDFIFVDFHAEATAEKVALAHHLDGRISALVGTHTHIPTADAQILSKGTGYLTDAGMCGDFDSCIGMEVNEPIKRFISKIDAGARFSPASKEATVCGVVMDLDDNTGLCKNITTIRYGGFLKEQQDFEKL